MLDRKPKLVRVGPLDATYAGAKVWVLAGPTESRDSSGYLPVLSRIAEGGPRSRVGLKPRRDQLLWEFEPTLDPSMVGGDLDLDPMKIEETMDRLVALKVDQPIFAANLHGYLAIGIDHGLGDAHAIIEIAAALTREGAPLPKGFVPPMPTLNVTKPMATVARRIITGAPIGIAADIVLEARMQSMRRRGVWADEGTQKSAEEASFGDKLPYYSTMFVRSGPAFLEALRDFRRQYFRGTSTTALMFFFARRELGRAGVRLTGTTGVLTDLRRFLRPNEATLANMAPVARMASPEGQTLPEFASSFHRSVMSTYPATRALAGVALWPLRSKSIDGAGDAHRGKADRVELVMSDVTKLPSLQKVHYRGPDTARINVVALPPAGRNYLTLAFLRVGSEIQVTATYFPDVIPPEILRAALQRALTIESLYVDQRDSDTT